LIRDAKPRKINTLEESNLSGSFQFLSFNVAGHYYGLDLLTIKEVSLWHEPTWIPNAPDYVKGIINIRGTIIPIIDLCDRFSLSPEKYDPLSKRIIIILHSKSNAIERSIGIPVYQVPNTYTIDYSDIVPFTDNKNIILKNYIRGLVTIENKMVMLLNAKDLMSDVI